MLVASVGSEDVDWRHSRHQHSYGGLFAETVDAGIFAGHSTFN